MIARRPFHPTLLALLIVALAADASLARMWVGGSGVHGWYYGGGDTHRGRYDDSASSDTGTGSNAAVAANDPNNGMNSPGAAGNDEAAHAAAAMDVARRLVEQRFESSPEWTEASMAFDEARAAFEQAKRRIIAALANDPRYQSAVRECVAINDALTALRASAAGQTSEQIIRTAAAAMRARAAVNAMESAACANDAAASAAAAKLKDATTVMAQLRQQEREAVYADAAWKSAQQTYQQSMGAMASARVTPSERMR
ncbi:MAG TPA: hypothetical protein VLI90_06290 [Tepidisphaeraceae bacterium]|nr:hypothetical protein [Tepidisphaeraceae bacterium]